MSVSTRARAYYEAARDHEVTHGPKKELRQRYGFRAALVTLAAILIVGIVALVHGGRSGTPTPGTAGDGSRATTAPSAVHPTDRSLDTTTAPIVRWSLYNGVFVPDGGTRYGPISTDPATGVASGYARTPAGALLAETNIAVRAVVGDQWRHSADLQLAGAGAQVFKDMRAGTTNEAPVEGLCQEIGFRILSWDPDSAVIESATDCPSGGLSVAQGGGGSVVQATIDTLQWVNGDWRLVPLPDGSLSTGARPLANLAGFINFAAEG